MTFSFFPPIPADFVSASVTMPRGTPIEATRAAVAKLSTAAQQLKLEFNGGEQDPARDGSAIVKHILSATGSQGASTQHGASGDRATESHVGEVVIELAPSEEHEDVTSESVAKRWRELTGTIPEAIELSFSAVGDFDISAVYQRLDDVRGDAVDFPTVKLHLTRPL